MKNKKTEDRRSGAAKASTTENRNRREKKGDFEFWRNLFGRPADDLKLLEALANSGIKRKIKIAKDELSETTELKGQGMEISFTDDSVLHPKSGVEGRAILSEVMMVFDDAGGDNYRGTLPHGIERSDSRDAVRAKLGKPKKTSNPFRWDAWSMGGLTVTARYAKDLRSLRVVSLSLPGS